MSYEIEFITDQRFKGTKAKLKSMDKQLKIAVDAMGCVEIRDTSEIRELNFPSEDYAGAKPHKQWRKTYSIYKTCRKPTWDEVMGKINKIQAPYYKRV